MMERAAIWRKYYYAHPAKMKARRIAAQRKNQEFVDSFKTSCSRCGIEDKRVLDFHHTKDKLRSVASLRVAGYSLARIKNEIDKCVLLCANCHRIHHHEERNAISI